MVLISEARLVLKETQITFKQKLMQGLQNRLKRRLSTIANRIQKQVRVVLEQAIKGQDEYVALTGRGANLKTELGLNNAQQRVDGIIEIFLNGLVVTTKPFSIRGSTIKGGLSLRMTTTYAELTNNELAIIRYNPPQRTGRVGPDFGKFVSHRSEVSFSWLESLLLLGSKVLVKDFDVSFDVGEGRSGGGIMVASPGARWSVPVEFQGTREDNWFTRAFAGVEEKIIKIVTRELKK